MTETQASLYEHLFPLTTIMKQRVVDNFDGDTLNERWTNTNVQGSNTFAMDDAIDRGFKITTGTSTADHGQIDFNDIRQYKHNDSQIIAVMKNITTTTTRTTVGFNDGDDIAVANNFTVVQNRFADLSFIQHIRNDGATSITATNSSISTDANVHLYDILTTSTNNILSIDNSTEVTSTTDLPTSKMQPQFAVRNDVAAARQGFIRYLEAYNI